MGSTNLWQPSKRKQSGFGAIEVTFVFVVVAVFIAVGLLIYQRDQANNVRTTDQQQGATTTTSQTNPYEGWQTYTASVEKSSFKYPPDWSKKALGASTEIELISPSKNVTVFWNGQISGLGGACDPTVMPGSPEAQTNSPGACPYWTVLDMKQLTGADLYYVSGVVTFDGTHYVPWFALQQSNGLLKTGGNMGYLTFMGKHNNIIDAEGRDLGVTSAELRGGESNQPPFVDSTGTETEDQAKAFFSTPEAQQAKLILLSYTY